MYHNTVHNWLPLWSLAWPLALRDVLVNHSSSHTIVPQSPRSCILNSPYILVTLESLRWLDAASSNLEKWISTWEWGGEMRGLLNYFCHHWFLLHRQRSTAVQGVEISRILRHSDCQWLCLSQVHGPCGSFYFAVSHLLPENPYAHNPGTIKLFHASKNSRVLRSGYKWQKARGIQATREKCVHFPKVFNLILLTLQDYSYCLILRDPWVSEPCLSSHL